MVRLVRSFPFTIVMLALLIGLAVWTKTHRESLSLENRRGLGFSPLHLPRGEWGRMLSSVFFTMGGVTFYASAGMLAVGVGMAEKLYGSGPAFLIFWGIHLVTLLIASLLLAIPLHLLEIYPGTLLATAHDVGPSAGYYGCLGAASSAVPERWRLPIVVGVMAILLVRLAWSVGALPAHPQAVSADLAHCIAFPLGLLIARSL